MDRRRSPPGGPPPPRRERPYPPHDPRDHEPREGRMREPRGYRGEPPEMRDRRRPRSSSPSYERYAPPPPRGPRMSPPPPKRYRRDDFYDRYDGPPSPDYRRSPPPPRERREERLPYREEPRPPPPHGRPPPFGAPAPTEPMTFKQFLLRVDDDVKPEEAQFKYQKYLEEVFGGKIRAEFEMKKHTDTLKNRFDPRYFEQALAAKNQEAVEAAKKFAEDVAEGKLKPEDEDFNQGSAKDLPPRVVPEQQANGKKTDGPQDGAAGEDDGAVTAPVLCWRPERAAVDFRVSRKLIEKLDAEKGITENVLLASQKAAAPEGEGEADAAKEEEGGAEEGAEKPKEGEAGDAEGMEVDVAITEENVEEYLRKLDLQLTYLYTVHGVDYYAGVELEAHEYSLRLKTARVLRGPCPEEGEGADEEVDKAAAEKLKESVDAVWEKRLESGDPLEAKCQRKRIEDTIEAWVQSQVEKHDDKKWGSKLSNKLFMAEHYVIKHIKNKHADAVAREKENILDAIYLENFKAAREAEQKQRQKEQQAAHKAAQAAAHGPEDQQFGEAPFEEYEEEMEEDFGPPFPGRGMRGRGRGRGMRGMGRRPPMMPMEAAMMAPPMMGMPGPMFVPAPGAGPMGPFILAPIPPHGAPMPMEVDPMAFGMRRGGRGGRGRGRGFGGNFMIAGPGAKLDPRGIREYYDLDAPNHNRAVLDYSDL